MSTPKDPGLRAVARVRDIRERDSRLGLQQAIALTAAREQEATVARGELAQAPAFAHGSVRDFHAQRAMLAALAARARRTRELAEASRASTEEARRRWQRDRSRLRAVESLLARRAEARRAEAGRREVRELDDIAGQLWLRRRGDAGASGFGSGPGAGPEGGDAA